MSTIFGILHEESAETVRVVAHKHSVKTKFFDGIRNIINELPSHKDDLFNHYTSVFSDDSCALHISYYPSDNEKSEVIRSAVQLVLHEIADRKVETYSGGINYEFRKTVLDDDGIKHDIKVTIGNGKMAPGCELVPETTTTTTYKLVCPGGEKDA